MPKVYLNKDGDPVDIEFDKVERIAGWIVSISVFVLVSVGIPLLLAWLMG